MVSNVLIVLIVVVSFILWIRGLRRKFVMLDDNVCQAMSQIGVQLSSRFDVLVILLRLTQHYAPQESEALIEIVCAKRRAITAKSTSADVLRQEQVIADVLAELTQLMTQHAELKTNESFRQTMDAVQVYENMLRTSQLLYNDRVTKLNREMQSFPKWFVARLLGFVERDYLPSK